MSSEKPATTSTKCRDAVVHLSYKQQNKFLSKHNSKLVKENAKLTKDYADAKVALMHAERQIAKLQVELYQANKLAH